MKIGMISDIHFGVKTNSNWYLDYQLAYFNEVVFPAFKEQGITHILQTGDLFHSRKSIDVYTYHQVKHLFLDKLQENGFKLLMIPGNHDLYLTESSEITSLSVLSEYDCVEVIRKPTVKNFDGFKIGMVPWISNADELKQFQTFTDECDCSTLFGHFEFSGYTIMPGIQQQGGMKESLVSKFDKVYSGHFHLKQSHPDSNIFYLGTPFEFDWGDWNTDKGFYVLDTANGHAEYIQNKRYIHYKIDYDENNLEELYKVLPKFKKKIVKVIVKNKKDEKLFTSFIYNLEQMGPVLYNIVDTPDNQIGAMEEEYHEQNIFSVIETYVKEKYDKPDRIIMVLKKLYQESTPQTTTLETK